MKKFIFKILSKLFKQQLIDSFIEEELPAYNIDMKNKNQIEKLADLYISSEYKLLAGLLKNKKNFLGKSLLNMKYDTEKEAHIKMARIQGQAYGISHLLHLVKYYNRAFQRSQDKKVKK